MNNDLEQFSEERLKELASTPEKYDHRYTCNMLNGDESRALARIALSVKQAKPVAWITWHQGCRAPDDSEDYLNAYTYKTEEKSVDGSDAFPVYTTPQPAHTDQDDTRRMDWLVSQNVEVRTPMPYGSHARFVAQCDSDDCEEYHTTLREQIDKAMFAAAPKPESE